MSRFQSPTPARGITRVSSSSTTAIVHIVYDTTTYAALPDQLELREIRKRVETPGFRVRDLVVMTTLLDPVASSHDAVLDLYQQRWHAELDLRSIKQFLQMDVLRCQQTLNEFRSGLLRANGERREELARINFEAIGRHRVGDRPNRCEPRAVKRRPKPHDLLTEPRAEARARLLERRDAEDTQ